MILLLTRKLSDKKARHGAIDSIKAKGRHIQGQALCNQGAVASKNGGKAPYFASHVELPIEQTLGARI